MLRIAAAIAFVLAITAAAAPAVSGGTTPAKGAIAASTTSNDESRWAPGPWQPPHNLKQTPIWPGAAPDNGVRATVQERIEIAQTPDALEGSTSEAAWDVSVPTMTVFPPKGRNSGAAIVVFPGGGFRAVVVTKQGTEICSWITSKGITCVLLKYRVPARENHHWPDECPCNPLQDAQRTVRLVRSKAQELHIDPDRIGVMGFSAGGFLVAQTSNIVEPTYKPVDAVDKLSSRPNFAIAFYPGHLCRKGDVLEPSINVSKGTPPTFLVHAWDDDVDPVCNSTVYARALDAAGVPSEVHIFAKGGHAFGLRHMEHPVGSTWPGLLESWLKEIGVLPVETTSVGTG
ncbi:alpha/beta hydrolase [Tahibacter sp.]|uniref:alpha/beta hydrolase n=1 Tax=Tahibacter sp. TaxID=2056211 RepID=UPI0028C3DFF9|nr:alpha/beta hydrolase [Tahibacter sp.]